MSYVSQYDFFRYSLIEKLNDFAKKNNVDVDFNSVLTDAKGDFGDYAFHKLSLGKNEEILKKIVDYFKSDDTFNVSVVSSFVNFTVKTNVLAKYTLNNAFLEGENYGKINFGKQKVVVLDYSSPNIAKPFSIAHLRSTVIGDSLRRIYSFLGYKTIGSNYLGDYGTQFGKLIYAYKTWADNEEGRARLDKEGISFLFELYVRYHKESESHPELDDLARKEFKKLEDGDEENVRIWKLFKDISLREFKRMYEKIRVEFDIYESESESAKRTPEIVEMLKKKKMLKKSQGAEVVDLEKEGLGVAIVLKSDGTTSYLTRDIATLLTRIEKYKADSVLYVVGSPQKLHFQQLFSIFHKLGYNKDFKHVNFGLYKFKNQKMSTRKGNIVFMDDVIEETIKVAQRIIEEKKARVEKDAAEKIAVAAIKYNDLSQDRVKDIIFDEEKMLRFEGDTAPYLNYALVRALSIVRRAYKKPKLSQNYTSFRTKSERKLIKQIYLFPRTLFESMNANKPSILAKYLLNLAKAFNDVYKEVKILKSRQVEEKLVLVSSFINTMKVGFNLLGMPYVERM